MTDQPPKKSLAEELKRRKTQELQRAAETKRISQATGAVPPDRPSIPAPVDPKRMSQPNNLVQPSGRSSSPSSAAPNRATQVTRSAPARPSADPRRATQVVPERKRAGQAVTIPERLAVLNTRQKLILAGSSLLILFICLGTALFATNQSPPSLPTPVQLPTSSTGNVLDYIKNVGVPITNLQTLTVPDTNWGAKQGVQFEVHRGTDKGQFILLSYDTPSDAGTDAYKTLTGKGKYQKWSLSQVSNIIILASPDSAPAINSEIGSHLSQYLVRPYNDFLPTATATTAPTSPAAATAAPTSKR